MNYRHAYHAGNFADVLKHVVLTLVIGYLRQKSAPFRVIDTHAGVGIYDLTGRAAQKTGEWRDGIGRLLTGPPPPAAIAPLLAPYLDLVRSFNPGGGVSRYPGSPLIARRLMRPIDSLIANELHPDDVAALRRALAGEAASKVLALDGYVALKALLPPKERRGLVLVDPPYEAADEFERLLAAALEFKRRFAGGQLIIWHPIKDRQSVDNFHRALTRIGLAKMLLVEQMVRALRRSEGLAGSGLAIVNPPFLLENELARMLPYLTERLAQDAGASFRLTRLGGP